MKFIVAEKNTPQGIILIVTDTEILGKMFEEDKKQLDLTNKFYFGEEKDTKYITEKLEDAHVVHFTGKKAVALGLSLDLIDKNRIMIVSGIPHAEVLIEE